MVTRPAVIDERHVKMYDPLGNTYVNVLVFLRWNRRQRKYMVEAQVEHLGEI